MKYTMEEVLDVMRRLVRAMDEAQDVGCVDHLDCWDEAETKWYLPIEQAKAILKDGGQ